MNIFYLHPHPMVAAQMMCDAHVVKMITESAQMLNAVSFKRTGKYLPSFPRFPLSVLSHPCTLWAEKNEHNTSWLARHMQALYSEYVYRYKKDSDKFFEWYKEVFPFLVYHYDEHTPPALAMPDMFKIDGDPVQSYHNYYRFKSKSMPRFTYTIRTQPEWIEQNG